MLSIADRWSTKTGDERFSSLNLTGAGTYLVTMLRLSYRMGVQYFIDYREPELGLCFGGFGNALSVR